MNTTHMDWSISLKKPNPLPLIILSCFSSLPGSRTGFENFQIEHITLVSPNAYIFTFQGYFCVFSLDPSQPRGRVCQLKICLFVFLSAISSTFPICDLQIIPDTCQTPHIIHQQKEDDISSDNYKHRNTHKHKYKDNDKDNVLKTHVICYIFQKQGVRGYQI